MKSHEIFTVDGLATAVHSGVNVGIFIWYLVKLFVLEIPLGKEVTAYCLVETYTKLEELIPTAMVKCGLTRVQLPL